MLFKQTFLELKHEPAGACKHVDIPVEVSADEVVDLGLAQRVQILELMQCRELLHVQAVWRDNVRLPVGKNNYMTKHLKQAAQPTQEEHFSE